MPSASEIIKDKYGEIVRNKYPQREYSWPILSGCDILNGEYGDYIICIFKHTGNRAMVSSNVIKFDNLLLDHIIIDERNIDSVREKIKNDFHLSNMDSVVILSMSGANLQSELTKLLETHEIVMGVVKMKVFLSHKGADKEKIRLYKRTLEVLGFDVWLDEDAMPAGTALHRGILQGFKDSCAAIFFITPNYVDEGFLESEVNYAMAEKMRRKDKFSIITLVFEDDGKKGQVPELLKTYVWKTPSNDLEALQEIVKALPIKLGGPQYK